MANEAMVNASMSITIRLVDNTIRVYNNVGPGSFTADMASRKGPSPGYINVDEDGMDVDLSQLEDPSLCELYNPGDVEVDLGVYDPGTGRLTLMLSLLPGEGYVIRFSRYLRSNLGPGTGGTGSIGADSKILRARAQGLDGCIYVGAFDR